MVDDAGRHSIGTRSQIPVARNAGGRRHKGIGKQIPEKRRVASILKHTGYHVLSSKLERQNWSVEKIQRSQFVLWYRLGAWSWFYSERYTSYSRMEMLCKDQISFSCWRRTPHVRLYVEKIWSSYFKSRPVCQTTIITSSQNCAPYVPIRSAHIFFLPAIPKS